MDHSKLPNDLRELIEVRLLYWCSNYFTPAGKCADCDRDENGKVYRRHWHCYNCAGLICNKNTHSMVGAAFGFQRNLKKITYGPTTFEFDETHQCTDMCDTGCNDSFLCVGCVSGAIETWCLVDWEIARGYSASIKYGTKVYKSNKQREQITPTVRHKIFSRDGFKCKLCGQKGDATTLVVDHVIPIAKGGTNSERNLQTLCDPCNAGKGAR